jgi:dTMP kinase
VLRKCYDVSPIRSAENALKTPGRFITFEGLDGCGKSTQLALLAEHLRGQGLPVTETREPGGTPVGQLIREILLHTSQGKISPLTELTLMFAARAQHIEQVILPALQRGEVVLCDRFTDSSVAYQGYGRGVALETIAALEKLLCQGVRPDLTLLLDIDVQTGLHRTGARNRQADQPDTRFEREGAEFFERVRRGYLEIARQEPQRVKVIDGHAGVEQVQSAIRRVIDELLSDRV